MSLVNKLLNDLESRQVPLPENQDMSLDGLYSAYDIEIDRVNNKGLNVNWLFVALLVAIVVYLIILSDEAVFGIHPVEESEISSQITISHEKSGETAHEVIMESIEPVKGAPDTSLFSLRLDDILTAYSESSPPVQVKENLTDIRNISLITSGGNIILSVAIPDEHRYVVYTLQSPHRTVLEIDDVNYSGTLPDIAYLDNVKAIRKQLDENGIFRFVVESYKPLAVESAGYVRSEDEHLLQITLHPPEEPVVESVPIQDSLQVTNTKLPTLEISTVTKGDLVKSIHQARTFSKTDEMVIEGLAQYRNGNIADALDLFYAAVKNDNSHSQARITLAVKLIDQGQREQAYSVLEEGLNQFPDRNEWRRLLAQAHIDAGNLETAREVLERSTPAITSDPDYHALHAALLQKLEQHQEAAVIYRNLLQKYPGNGLWWMGLAISLEAISQKRDAVYAYNNALKGHSLTPQTQQYISRRIHVLNQQLANEPS